MKEILETFKGEKKIIGIYTGDDTEYSYNGFLCDVDEKYVLFASVSTRGRYDGLRLTRIDAVTKIESDGEYEKKLQKLFEKKQQSFREPALGHKKDLLESFLKYCQKERIFVEIYLKEEDAYTTVGEILYRKDDLLILQGYTGYGKKGSIVYIKKEKIDMIAAESEELQDIFILSRD